MQKYYSVHKRGFELGTLKIKEKIYFRMKLETLGNIGNIGNIGNKHFITGIRN
jgi:hypothetical protein